MKNIMLSLISLFLSFSLPVYAQTPTPATPATSPAPAKDKDKVSAGEEINGNPMAGKVVRPVSKVDPGTGGRKDENKEFEKKELSWEPTDDKTLLKSIDYPELQVVPRATERLNLESQYEAGSIFGPYWPVQVSAGFLLLAASGGNGKYKYSGADLTDARKEENALATQTGNMVGGMWLGATFYLQYIHSYSKSQTEVKRVSGKDKKSELLRERLAEEALEKPAKIAKTMTNLAVWTQFIAAGYILSQSEQGSPDMAGIALGMSFLPYFFENRFISNWEKHQEYKRKIYAPVSTFNFIQDSNSGKLTPLLGLRWEF